MIVCAWAAPMRWKMADDFMLGCVGASRSEVSDEDKPVGKGSEPEIVTEEVGGGISYFI